MPLLVADCPRCGAAAHTFDVLAHIYRSQDYGWVNYHEVFSVCRNCDLPTIFGIRMTIKGREIDLEQSQDISNRPNEIMSVKGSLNRFFEVVRYVSLRDNQQIEPPEHLSGAINKVFKEAAACYSIECYNAAGTMLRLCLDLASRPLLPDPSKSEVLQPDERQRRELGRRLGWLFQQGLVPVELKGLATCVREDGNDGAHAGNLSKEDASDLLDFTVAFLERLITEPKKLELAEARRKERRKGVKK